jgi:hypothetical protein
VSKIFKETFIDVGRTIVSLEKVERDLKDVLDSLHDEKLALFHKIWKTDDYKTPLKDVIDSQALILKQQSTLSNIFDSSFLNKFPHILALFNNK